MAPSVRSVFMIRIRSVWARLILLLLSDRLRLCFFSKLHALRACLLASTSYLRRMLVQRKNLGWIQLSYFLFESILGFLLLRSLDPTTRRKTDLDLFFMSASAATDSSMLTVEMEAFSHPQLLVLALMMLFSGEVFTSLLDLQLLKCELVRKRGKSNMKTVTVDVRSSSTDVDDGSTQSQIELVIVELPNSACFKPSPVTQSEDQANNEVPRVLSYVILGYLLLSHLLGSVSIFAYLSLVPSAREVIRSKGFDHALPFSIFMTISSFANAGFSPLNENMMPFKRNPGMLSIFIPLLLVGNTLFPVCLRLAVEMLKSFTKREEFDYLLKNSEKVGFHHLHSRLSSVMLFITVVGLVTVQTAFFCFMEWNSKPLDGLNPYQKLVGSLFQSVDVRHAGESLFDLSLLSPAILVSYVVLMYLPPYTSFTPMEEEERSGTPTVITKEKKSQRGLIKSLLMSQLTYLAISIILICITEREKLTRDPLNFNVLNITIEVISAFGNVGFSTGYSCDRQLKPDENCKARWYGFVGTWSSQGKFILIAVMFFGKLKKFSRKSGKAWKLN
ncbi:sodium transporter HKT1-like [Asparagus officinalis]|uniref:sodium transporter HKT1-like n=1 Tax=Asparagus officinalis TaxID=4686 RepID=UPI00098E2D6D|nr:sodium transporter HKT1-like [Asparagus officinalis]